MEGTTLVSVTVATRPVLTVGQMRRLFKSPGLTNVQLSAGFYADAIYSGSRDGQRFLFPELIGPAGKPVIHVVENWFEELAIERGEIEAEHPLSAGPWVLNRRALDTVAVAQLVERIRTKRRTPALASQDQAFLDLSIT